MPTPLWFVTITFEEDIPPQKAERWVRELVSRLNQATLGKNYHGRVRHSFFGYLFVTERQSRGALHLHGLIDNRIDLRVVYAHAHAYGGLAHIERVRDPEAVIGYIFKSAVEPALWYFPARRWVWGRSSPQVSA